jgi:hypothetical protein
MSKDSCQTKDPMADYAMMKLRMLFDRPFITGDTINKSADGMLVRVASSAMDEKLRLSREKGRGGWWDSSTCSIEDLKRMLVEHVDKGDMVDVMNFAAMIYFREVGGSFDTSQM